MARQLVKGMASMLNNVRQLDAANGIMERLFNHESQIDFFKFEISST